MGSVWKLGFTKGVMNNEHGGESQLLFEFGGKYEKYSDIMKINSWNFKHTTSALHIFSIYSILFDVNNWFCAGNSSRSSGYCAKSFLAPSPQDRVGDRDDQGT